MKSSAGDGNPACTPARRRGRRNAWQISGATGPRISRPFVRIFMLSRLGEGKAEVKRRQNFPANSFRWHVPVGKDVGEMVEAGLPVKDWVKVGVSEFTKVKRAL